MTDRCTPADEPIDDGTEDDPVYCGYCMKPLTTELYDPRGEHHCTCPNFEEGDNDVE